MKFGVRLPVPLVLLRRGQVCPPNVNREPVRKPLCLPWNNEKRMLKISWAVMSLGKPWPQAKPEEGSPAAWNRALLSMHHCIETFSNAFFWIALPLFRWVSFSAVLASPFPQTVYFRTYCMREWMNRLWVRRNTSHKNPERVYKRQEKTAVFPAVSVASDWDTFQWCSGPVIRTKKAVENKSPGLLMQFRWQALSLCSIHVYFPPSNNVCCIINLNIENILTFSQPSWPVM